MGYGKMRLKIWLLVVFSVFLSLSARAEGKSDVTFLNPHPVLPFSEAVKVGKLLIMSGQIAISPESGKLVTGGFADEVTQVMDNIKAVLQRHQYGVQDVVKCTVILTDLSKFKEFNEIYATYFKSSYPARTAFAAQSLALGAQVEVECMAAK